MSVEAESVEDELSLCVKLSLPVVVDVDELPALEQPENAAIIASILQAAITFFTVFPLIIITLRFIHNRPSICRVM